ncbi:MAG: DUF2927 domain-containing protein [Pseudomonadota bacterium]
MPLAATILVSGCAEPAKFPDAAYWDRYVLSLRAEGRMRTERTPEDAPFTNADVLESFRNVIFYDEYDLGDDGRFIFKRVPRNLERQVGPVTIEFYASSRQRADRTHLDDIIARLRRVTGLEITEVEDAEDASIQMFILDEEERRQLASSLPDKTGWIGIKEDLRGDMGDTLCAAYSYQSTDDPDRQQYLIVIPDELRGSLRQSCIEEELGQAFGPAADWDGARPSIFNDDEEFALLTEHDEWLLRILYHPDLRPGMSEAEAMPIAKRIIQELRPGGA